MIFHVILKGHDFSEDKLMNSGNLYSLYLLNSDSSSEQLKTSENLLETSLSSSAASAKDTKKDNGDTDEEIDVETDGVKDPSPEKVLENGHYDALFEGMPFTELKGKEVGKYLVFLSRVRIGLTCLQRLGSHANR